MSYLLLHDIIRNIDKTHKEDSFKRLECFSKHGTPRRVSPIRLARQPGSQRLPKSGYALEHWELQRQREFNGQPNSILMNMNHILIVSFTIAPPPPSVNIIPIDLQWPREHQCYLHQTSAEALHPARTSGTQTERTLAYSLLVCLFVAVLITVKRKRK